MLGVKLGWVEGIELNVLGLVAGLDLRHPAVKLPAFGRIGVDAAVARAAGSAASLDRNSGPREALGHRASITH